jgi:hypothetical protein
MDQRNARKQARIAMRRMSGTTLRPSAAPWHAVGSAMPSSRSHACTCRTSTDPQHIRKKLWSIWGP